MSQSSERVQSSLGPFQDAGRRPAGTEKSAVRLSMCAGTWLFQSRFSSAHSERNCRALLSPKKARLNGWKVFDFPLENSGFEVETPQRASSGVSPRLCRPSTSSILCVRSPWCCASGHFWGSIAILSHGCLEPLPALQACRCALQTPKIFSRLFRSRLPLKTRRPFRILFFIL